MDIETRLKALEGFVDSDGDADTNLFNVKYSELLNLINKSGGRKYPLLLRLRHLAGHRGAFLMNLILKEKGLDVIRGNHLGVKGIPLPVRDHGGMN